MREEITLSNGITSTYNNGNYFVNIPKSLNYYGLTRADFIRIVARYCNEKDMEKCLEFISR